MINQIYETYNNTSNSLSSELFYKFIDQAHALSNSILNGDKKGFLAIWENINCNFFQNSKRTCDDVKTLYILIINTLISQVLVDNAIITESRLVNILKYRFENIYYNFTTVNSIVSLQIIDEFKNILLLLIDDINANKSEKCSIYVKYIKTFVNNNYNTKVSLTKISQDLHISRNYLSYIFKKETGESFIDYVEKFRINKAKELMKTENLMIYEIAEKVGYFDSAHFSKSFKKLTGKTPSEYMRSSTNF
ncbi:helix-turn-helix domain-containing protein [Mahella sp.]|uniref:helix-turn-helix domain-containing protein n=1 Tax=Mahella sp. TaxID=2798721 RepID=UPI0025BA0F5C|nr:helix-turn-helix domain-containing protein [Mahella sp.]MBZ4664854.1 AraC family transcriptional regulator [Mahella sp.]